MKKLLLMLIISPVLVRAQSESIIPGVAIPKPQADTLKPIEIREYPYTYGSRSYVTTSLARIYSYDGIDVQNPAKELWPRMLALNDPAVNQEYITYTAMRESRSTANVFGGIFMTGGLVALIIGSVQAHDYQQALSAKRQAWYTASSRLVTTPAPATITKTCSTWTGSSFGSGPTQWRCATDPSITYTGDYPPSSVQVPNPNSTPTVGFAPQPPIPTSVDMPDGKGLVIGGFVSMMVGTIIVMAGPRGTDDHLHRAVQLYNRALQHKISWRLLPYGGYGVGGATLLGAF